MMEGLRSVQGIAGQSAAATIIVARVQGLWEEELPVLAVAEPPREIGPLA